MYVGHQCRCPDCTAANAEYQAALKARLSQTDPALIPHGRNGYENYGCRCPVCVADKSVANAEYRARMTPGVAS